MFYPDSPGSHRITDQFATYFLTFTIVGWIDVFTRRQCCQIIIDSLTYCQQHKGLILYGYVIMGSHLHLLARAAEGSNGLSALVRDFKTFTSKAILAWMKDNCKESRRHWMEVVFRYHAKYNSNNQAHQVWIQDSYPILCESEKFLRQKLNYIHNNPVKAGIVDRPEDYRYSSARNYLLRKDAVMDVTLLEYGSNIGLIRG